MHDNQQDAAESQDTSRYLRLTPEQFSMVKRRRYHYLILYGFICVIWVGARVASYQGLEIPSSLNVATIACQVLFYFQFIAVLARLGYGFAFILGACLFVFLPIPGLLILAIVDRQIAGALDSASPDSARRPPPEESSSEQ